MLNANGDVPAVMPAGAYWTALLVSCRGILGIDIAVVSVVSSLVLAIATAEIRPVL